MSPVAVVQEWCYFPGRHHSRTPDWAGHHGRVSVLPDDPLVLPRPYIQYTVGLGRTHVAPRLFAVRQSTPRVY